MIIVLKPGASKEDVDRLLERIHGLGYRTHLSRGEQRTIVGIIGDEDKARSEPFEAFPGVERVLPILTPYKLASREAHAGDTVVVAGPARFGGGEVSIIGGPCAVEGREMLFRIAGPVKEAGAVVLRGGAFKPRTSPYTFQGLGEEGLRYLRECGDALGLPVVTEVMDTRQVGLVERYADLLQIGARNMQNFPLLSEVGESRKPVILKRGLSATVKEFLQSAEYILARGNPNVILCERGVRSFEDSVRNLFDVSAIPNLKKASHLPVIADPSHATGRADLVVPVARAAIAAGADGLLVDVHDDPAKALVDGPQALLPAAFAALCEDARRIAEVLGRTVVGPVGSVGPVGARV
ncbi:MAG: 3-deoxy-7-phosphoheptulonate synthase [Planctomycetales bacterium]|nr:3-deoxy-7-phosphoheptulonate synthase [Planctomycetales bacterium]